MLVHAEQGLYMNRTTPVNWPCCHGSDKKRSKKIKGGVARKCIFCRSNKNNLL